MKKKGDLATFQACSIARKNKKYVFKFFGLHFHCITFMDEFYNTNVTTVNAKKKIVLFYNVIESLYFNN